MATRPGSLDTYQAKRDFARTPEPAGTVAAGDGRRFVVHRHRARRLHYDLRLEVGGVLASWAVPKGPTLDPTARVLAVRVEDHPIEYLDFEGVIPRGEYGGGDVIVWDRGTWSPAGGEDPAAAIEHGELHFDLHGEKLAGRFVLVRTDHDAQGDGRSQWLLLHKRDEHAVEGWNPEDHPRSVLSGRTNEEVAAAPDALWRPDQPAAGAEVRFRPSVPSPTDDELAALDAIDGKGRWSLAGRVLSLTNLDKVLFPGRDGGAPVTKRDLVRYFAQVAPVLVPYLAERPLNMHRFPDGVTRKGFWHKELPSHAPKWLGRWHNPEAAPGDTQWYVVADSAPALAWLANFAAIELHPWTSRIPDVHCPTWALIDIDPGPATSLDDLLLLARLHRTALEHLGVVAGAKVTGRRGIQIWIPVAHGYSFAETRAWVEQLSRAIGSTVPELVSWAWRTDERGGRARLDFTQNALNKTLVAPWSTRPAPGAPVSVPITWDELDDPDLRPDRWTIRDVAARLEDAGDPLAPLIGVQQRLPTLT